MQRSDKFRLFESSGEKMRETELYKACLNDRIIILVRHKRDKGYILRIYV